MTQIYDKIWTKWILPDCLSGLSTCKVKQTRRRKERSRKFLPKWKSIYILLNDASDRWVSDDCKLCKLWWLNFRLFLPFLASHRRHSLFCFFQELLRLAILFEDNKWFLFVAIWNSILIFQKTNRRFVSGQVQRLFKGIMDWVDDWWGLEIGKNGKFLKGSKNLGWIFETWNINGMIDLLHWSIDCCVIFLSFNDECPSWRVDK